MLCVLCAQAQELVESAYNASGGLPVYLMGHSNGPVYALALLNSTTPEWREQYVGEPQHVSSSCDFRAQTTQQSAELQCLSAAASLT